MNLAEKQKYVLPGISIAGKNIQVFRDSKAYIIFKRNFIKV
jgi:hypothetical protein